MKETRLDQKLVKQGLVSSRTKAAALIMAGQVKVNKKVQDKPGFFIKDDEIIEVDETPRYVSRGGEKLESVADKLKLDFTNKIILDVGSSTGGFTDFALLHGAQKVYAVDVGTSQLDWSLRTNSKVIVMEKTDIRDVKSLPETIDIVLIDVSFISLRLILPTVARLANPNTQIVAMVKPHFEADRVTVSKNKGIIKNDTIRRGILKKVEEFMKDRFVILAKADSEVRGRKGNLERFYLLKLAK